VGFIVLAAIHSGILTGLPPVDECRGDLYLNARWGVENPATIDLPGGESARVVLFKFDFNGERIELFRHPLFYVTEDVQAWYNSFVATKENFCSQGHYLDMPPIWMDCYFIYNKYLQKFEKIKAK